MTTLLGHALVGVSCAALAPRRTTLSGTLSLVATCGLLAMLPDVDVLAFRAGISYGAALGHRGVSHSVLFALISSFVVWLPTLAFGRQSGRGFGAWLVYFVSALSHPLLDMLTNGGLGVALWAPFSFERTFFPWRPIPVSPLRLVPDLWGVLAWEANRLLPWTALLWAFRARQLLQGSFRPVAFSSIVERRIRQRFRVPGLLATGVVCASAALPLGALAWWLGGGCWLWLSALWSADGMRSLGLRMEYVNALMGVSGIFAAVVTGSVSVMVARVCAHWLGRTPRGLLWSLFYALPLHVGLGWLAGGAGWPLLPLTSVLLMFGLLLADTRWLAFRN